MNDDRNKKILQTLLTGKELFIRVTEGMNSEGEFGEKHNTQSAIIAFDRELFERLQHNGLGFIYSAERLEDELRKIVGESSLRSRGDILLASPHIDSMLAKDSKSFLEVNANRLIGALRRYELNHEAGTLSQMLDDMGKDLDKDRPIAVRAFNQYFEGHGLEGDVTASDLAGINTQKIKGGIRGQ